MHTHIVVIRLEYFGFVNNFVIKTVELAKYEDLDKNCLDLRTYYNIGNCYTFVVHYICSFFFLFNEKKKKKMRNIIIWSYMYEFVPIVCARGFFSVNFIFCTF